MPRKRTPSATQQTIDRITATALANAIDQLAAAYPHEFSLQAASRGIREFAESAVQQPKPRTRKPKAPPLAVPVDMMDALRRGLPATDA
jgi:hypothetical protein